MKRQFSVAQLTQQHRFTVIGRTINVQQVIQTLLNDKYIINGPYKSSLAFALTHINKACELVREAEINIGAR
jgi:hypothetical protein